LNNKIEDKKRLEQFAVKEFKQHWARILRTLEKGKNTYAKKKYTGGYFQAYPDGQEKLADRFYGITHARKMANLSDQAIRKNLSCYLPKAIKYTLGKYSGKAKEQKYFQEYFIKELINGEYVLFKSLQCSPFELYNDNSTDITVYSSVAWYEAFVFEEVKCLTFALMKSTGESFSNEELDLLKRSILYDIDFDAFEMLWSFECEPITKNKIWIKIYELDRDTYIEAILGIIWSLSKMQLISFIRKIIHYLATNKELMSVIKTFENYKSARTKDLSEMIENLFETKELSDYDVKELEYMMNRTRKSPRKSDRDYHWGMNY